MTLDRRMLLQLAALGGALSPALAASAAVQHGAAPGRRIGGAPPMDMSKIPANWFAASRSPS